MEPIREFNIYEPLASLLQACEVYCVAGCCQDNAFDCGVEQVGPWIAEHGNDAARIALLQIQELRENLPHDGEALIATDLFMANWRKRELDFVLSKTLQTVMAELLEKQPD